MCEADRRRTTQFPNEHFSFSVTTYWFCHLRAVHRAGTLVYPDLASVNKSDTAKEVDYSTRSRWSRRV